MKTLLTLAALVVLLVGPVSSFAMMDIELLTPARAKELGMQIRSKAAGPDLVRVELEFEAKGDLKAFSRVDLEMTDGGKLLLTSTLRQEPSSPGHILVSFAADRTNLDKLALRVVTQPAPRDMEGYEIRLKDLVELEKGH